VAYVVFVVTRGVRELVTAVPVLEPVDPVRVKNIAGHVNLGVTLNTYADEFDRPMHCEDLLARIQRAGFEAV
jgi:hypothetical protein